MLWREQQHKKRNALLQCMDLLFHAVLQAAKDLLQELVVWPMLNPALCQVRVLMALVHAVSLNAHSLWH